MIMKPTGERLLKGLEEEVYVGTYAGDPVSLSHLVVAEMPEYDREPDARIVEYITDPQISFDTLGRTLLHRRRKLRKFLQALGDYTLIPGGALSLGSTGEFFRSNPGNPYHGFIEQRYGTDVVTTSAHLNIGIEDPEELIRTCGVLRMEASLFLALTACSPFLDGEVTGHHSTRWSLFPVTPREVPIFSSHAHYTRWVEEQLTSGAMYNVRHLWASARPNGVGAPHQLQRLELRICDRMDRLDLSMAVTALLEARCIQVLTDPTISPLTASAIPALELPALARDNEAAAAHHSLEAEVHHWRDGRALPIRQWLETTLAEVTPTARALGFSAALAPLERVLSEGNTAQRWLKRHARGTSIRTIIEDAIGEMLEQEKEYAHRLPREAHICPLHRAWDSLCCSKEASA